MLTEELEIDGTNYILKTALGWYEMQQIEQSQFRLFADGKSVSEADNIATIPLLEIRLDTADATLKRLTTWLVAAGGRGYKPIEAMKIPPAHVPVLLARIEELEAAQAAEVKALADAHPLTAGRAAKPALPAIEKSLKE